MDSTPDTPELLEYFIRNERYFREMPFYLKAHPTRHDRYDKLDKRRPPIKIELCRDREPHKFYDKIDVLVVGSSTAGVEALGQGIPVVVVGDSVRWGTGTLFRHRPDNGVYIAKSPEEVTEAICLFKRTPPPRDNMRTEFRYYVGSFQACRMRAVMKFLEKRGDRHR